VAETTREVGRISQTNEENEMTAYKGVYYFPTRQLATAYAMANDWPVDRLIEYDRGWAVQLRISGPYVGPNTIKE